MRSIKEVFSSNLRKLRGDRTQAEVAEAANIALRTLQKLESGQLPREENLMGLAKAFDVPETQLYFDEDLVRQPGPAEALKILAEALNIEPPNVPKETQRFYDKFNRLDQSSRKLIDLIISGALDEAQADMLIHSISALNQPQTDKERRKA